MTTRVNIGTLDDFLEDHSVRNWEAPSVSEAVTEQILQDLEPGSMARLAVGSRRPGTRKDALAMFKRSFRFVEEDGSITRLEGTRGALTLVTRHACMYCGGFDDVAAGVCRWESCEAEANGTTLNGRSTDNG